MTEQMTAIDALAAPTRADPYPYYAELAAGPALAFDARLGLWLAAGAAAVEAVLGEPRCRVRPLAEPVPAALAGGGAGAIFGELVRMNDGARHRQPKLALQRALAGVDPLALRAGAAAVAAASAATRDLRQPAQLSDWMVEVPLYTVAGLIGFPRSQWPALAAWMADFVACLSPLSSAAQIAGANAAAQQLLHSFEALLRQAAPQPGSLLQAVLREAAEVGWDGAGAILANLVGLLSQTYEATAGLVGNSIVALLSQPGLARAVGAAPERVDALVHEVSRFDPPVHNTRRYMAQAGTLCGVDVAAGQTILVLLAAASRDPAANPRPHEFLLERPARRVFGFGHGPHACPGHALACSIAAAAVAEWRRRPPAPGALAWRYRRSVNARIPVFHLAQGQA
ncbi:cytochrome P450 [Janthinobacterium sp. CG_S6]|nr:cytochrome P450 [Janthinobacterium sp. CG_S6]